jgi:septal ring factor EnvC (AmiA/AmiB activator)
MTKPELKEPTDLKRSKSASDIPSPFSKGEETPFPLPPKSPTEQTKYPYTTLITQNQEIEQLKKESEAKSSTIKLLRDKIEKLEDQEFKFKQELAENEKDVIRLEKEVTKLTQELKPTSELTLTSPNPESELSELDQNLVARAKNLGD